MPSVRVIALPTLLTPADLNGRVAVVFDVLRATTTIAAALAAGADCVRAFGSIDDARAAAGPVRGDVVLAGEQHCVAPPGFDLGNSPGDFTADRVGGRTICLATTNGTRALVAAKAAEALFCGALVNAAATGRAVANTGLPVTLIASGTQGMISTDDLLGCAAVMAAIPGAVPDNDTAHLSLIAWAATKDDLPRALRQCASAHHLMNANLPGDIEFCSRRDCFDVAARVRLEGGILVVRRVEAGPRLG